MNSLLLTLSMVYSSINSMPMDVPHSAIIIAPFANATEITNQKIAQLINIKPFAFIRTFPDSGRKKAVLEQESFISQQDTKYGNLQEFVAGFYHPKPIVDTIQEHEKYGNDGGKIRSAGIAFIAGFEGLSNLLNAAVEAPFQVVRQFGKKISNSINLVGGKFNGL